ncbi:MAG TPA: nuclease-related domain-containing protein [Leptolyngbyaceae cyanobacterium]
MKIGPKRKNKSPLKDKPLRNPRQSLDEELQRLMEEDGYTWVATICFCLIFLANEWWRYFSASPPNPLEVTIVTLPMVGFSIFKLYRLKRRLQRLRLARDGEKAVGQYLTDLRENGYRIFHDIVGDDFNVDHVIISEQGIFTIETKTYSKPISGKAVVTFDGEAIQVNGYTPDRVPVEQAQAQAAWVQGVLRESTGRGFSVRPVVVFPRWFVEMKKTALNSKLWVLNPKALPGSLEHEPVCISAEEVKLAAYHLSRYIRSSQ